MTDNPKPAEPAPSAAPAEPATPEQRQAAPPAEPAGELPPLPKSTISSFQSDSTMRYTEVKSYSATDMRAYANAAIAAMKPADREPKP